MFYNEELKREKTQVDCLNCRFFDSVNKKCLGFGKICFEFDPKTKTIFNPKTGLPKKIGE